MAVPTHRDGCTTQLFPWRCPDCGDEVFFFACTCGSRVFFDTPGPPWTPHKDRCVEFLIRELREIRGMKDRDIVELVREHARNTDATPVKDITRYVDRQRGQRKLTILEVAPRDEDQMAIGVVKEINEVNFEKRLGVEGTPLGKQFLGPFKQGKWKEVIIREPDRGKSVEPLYQFTFVVNTRAFDPSILRVGATIMVQLSTVKLVMERRFWVSDDFRIA